MAIRATAQLAALTLIITSLATAAEPPPKYKDPSRPVSERVEDLLARMTLEEKVAQMITVWNSKTSVMNDRLQIDPVKLKARYPDGPWPVFTSFGFARPRQPPRG